MICSYIDCCAVGSRNSPDCDSDLYYACYIYQQSNKSVVVQQSNLPATIEGLSKFVLVGREKLTSVRLKLEPLKSLNLQKK